MLWPNFINLRPISQVDSAPFEVRYVNDYSPAFSPVSGSYNASISEDTSIGTFVLKVNATDDDSGSQGEVSFSIVSGNVGDAFVIDAVTGAINTSNSLDRETEAVYNLVVRASDGAVAGKVRYTDGSVEVHLSDINDNAPSFGAPVIRVAALEDALIGDAVTTIQATDPDEGLNQEIRYSITAGNGAGLFLIDEVSGEITVNSSLDLDGENPVEMQHSLVILAKDQGAPVSLNSSVELRINVSAVNEFTPQLLHGSSFNFSFLENVGVGQGVFVVQVNATDDDFGDQGDVSYAVSSGQ